MLPLTFFLMVAVMLSECCCFQVSQQTMYPPSPSGLHFSKRMQKEIIQSEICMGSRCAASLQEKQSDRNYLINTVILSLIVLAIHWTVNFERKRAGNESAGKSNSGARSSAGFRRTIHSTSLDNSSLSPSPIPCAKRPSPQSKERRSSHPNGTKVPSDEMANQSDYEVRSSLHPSPLPSDISSYVYSRSNSLSPSPVPCAKRPSPQSKERRSSHPNDTKVPWDEMANQSDYEVCLSLHPSPLHSDASNTTSGIFPSVPPRRWRNNSRLNLVGTPDVAPTGVNVYYHL